MEANFLKDNADKFLVEIEEINILKCSERRLSHQQANITSEVEGKLEHQIPPEGELLLLYSKHKIEQKNINQIEYLLENFG